MIIGHGDDMYSFGGKIRCNFSSNIYGGADHSGLMRYLAGRLDFIGRYPEPDAMSLEKKIAEWKDIDHGCIMVTAGVTEAIYQIAQAYTGGRSLILSPTFSEYEDASRMFGHTVDFCVSPDEIVAKGIQSDLVWICNPNNPTGEYYDPEMLAWLMAKQPETLFVMDQAYEDYGSGPVFSHEETVRHSNMISLHSLTKRFCVPGLRIGYGVACRNLLVGLRRFRKPWTVSAMSADAVAYLIDNEDLYDLPAVELQREASFMRKRLKDLGIESRESSTNFILCRLPKGTAAGLKLWLVEKYGLLIRDASNFRGLDDRWIRIAAQDRDENRLLINAIQEWLEL